ncbi:MAG: hypothetical protein IPK26_19745 [Planctomycetes bacterium]|nr:hypothetical protein [Planctomycetota bacterium]
MRTAIHAVLLSVLVAQLPAQYWEPVNGVPQRVEFALAHDLARGQTVLFGGAQAPVIQSTFFRLHGDTWIHDAGGWRWTRPATAPAPRARHSMAFDAARQRTVLFGGFVGASATHPQPGFVAETWEHDGVTWYQRVTAHQPPANGQEQMAFDLTRARSVLFVQGRSDTWEYDGIDWQLANPTTRPPANLWGSMAYGLARQRLVLLGFNWSLPIPKLQTWEYDGVTWAEVTTAHLPTISDNSVLALAGDVSGEILLQTTDLQGPVPSTWRYDGVDWQPIATAHQPTELSAGGLVFELARGRHVRYDGTTTWEFDGIDWLQTEARLLPQQRGDTVPLVDGARGRILLFGGIRAGIGVTSELLTWTGQQWQPLPATVQPPPRFSPVGAFDTRRDRIVMHGGFGTTTLTDTWEYDGATWHQISTNATPSPPPTAMAYDPVRGRCVAYGALVIGPFSFADTWLYDSTDWQSAGTTHQPPPRSAPVLVYDATHDAIAMYGGGALGSTTVHTDTWWLQNGDWRQQNPQIRPPVAWTIGTHDPARGRLVLATSTPLASTQPGAWYEYDGLLWSRLPVQEGPAIDVVQSFRTLIDPRTGRPMVIGVWGDIWTYVPPPVATFAPLGTGCSNGPSPRLAAAAGSTPQLGGTFTLEVTGLPTPGALFVAYGFGHAAFLRRALPIELSALGQPDCLLWLEPSGLGAVVTHAGTVATHSLALPANPALAGTRLVLQALPFDAATPLGIGAPSNAGIATAF